MRKTKKINGKSQFIYSCDLCGEDIIHIHPRHTLATCDICKKQVCLTHHCFEIHDDGITYITMCKNCIRIGEKICDKATHDTKPYESLRQTILRLIIEYNKKVFKV